MRKFQICERRSLLCGRRSAARRKPEVTFPAFVPTGSGTEIVPVTLCGVTLFYAHVMCRDTDARATEYVRCMREVVQLEREDVLARLRGAADLQDELRIAVSAATQKELQRLRDELFKARRNEVQKERETAFLQRQLVEAARRIAQATVDSEQQLVDKLSQNHPLGDTDDYDV